MNFKLKLNNALGKALITAKNCPLASPRDVLVWSWEVYEPIFEKILEEQKKYYERKIKRLKKL